MAKFERATQQFVSVGEKPVNTDQVLSQHVACI